MASNSHNSKKHGTIAIVNDGTAIVEQGDRVRCDIARKASDVDEKAVDLKEVITTEDCCISFFCSTPVVCVPEGDEHHRR